MDDWLDKMKEKNDYESRMIQEHRCILCGSPLTPEKWADKVYYPRYKTCIECFKQANSNKEDPKLARIIGSGHASMHHEGLKKMGYSPAQRRGPDMRKTEDFD